MMRKIIPFPVVMYNRPDFPIEELRKIERIYNRIDETFQLEYELIKINLVAAEYYSVSPTQSTGEQIEYIQCALSIIRDKKAREYQT